MRKNINDVGGKHCLTCASFPNTQFVDHKFFCPKKEKWVAAGASCEFYKINTRDYYEAIEYDPSDTIYMRKSGW